MTRHTRHRLTQRLTRGSRAEYGPDTPDTLGARLCADTDKHLLYMYVSRACVGVYRVRCVRCVR